MILSSGFRKVSRVALVAGLMAALTPPLEAQNAKQGDEQLVLRTYPVGDFVVNVPDYTVADGGAEKASQSSNSPYYYGGGGFGGGGMGGGAMGRGRFGAAPGTEAAMGAVMDAYAGAVGEPSRQITMSALVDTIRHLVAPQTWQSGEHTGGNLTSIGSSLVILQTPRVHDEIGRLLDELRESAARRTFTIDARWLLLGADELDRLMSADKDGARKVSGEVLAEFTRRPTSLRGITTCFSGQSVYVISGTRRNVVSGYIPVVGSVEVPGDEVLMGQASNKPAVVFAQFSAGGEMGAGGVGGYGGRSVGYQPVVEKPNFGVLLEIRPTMMHRENSAVVELKSTVTMPGAGAVDPGMGEAAFAPGTPTVDRVAIQTQELATALIAPLGEPVLVGGMTYMADDGAGLQASVDPVTMAEVSEEKQQLYLVLEVR